METTIGFAKEFPSIPVCGFNVYHKNRLIRVSFGKAEVTSPCNPICLYACVFFFFIWLCFCVFLFLFISMYVLIFIFEILTIELV